MPAETEQRRLEWEEVVWICGAGIHKQVQTDFPICCRIVTDLQDNCNCFVSTPWPLAYPHFMNNTSDAPDVYLLIVTLLHRIDDFRRHPEHCTRHRCGCAETINVVRPLGNTEVRDFTDACCFNQNIVRFQILRQSSQLREGLRKTKATPTRWRIPLECRYSRPVRICSVNDFVTSSSNLPCFSRQLPMEPPGTYSKKL